MKRALIFNAPVLLLSVLEKGGLGTIDLHDWKSNTRLKHCSPDTPQVSFFLFGNLLIVIIQYSTKRIDKSSMGLEILKSFAP